MTGLIRLTEYVIKMKTLNETFKTVIKYGLILSTLILPMYGCKDKETLTPEQKREIRAKTKVLNAEFDKATKSKYRGKSGNFHMDIVCKINEFFDNNPRVRKAVLPSFIRLAGKTDSLYDYYSTLYESDIPFKDYLTYATPADSMSYQFVVNYLPTFNEQNYFEYVSEKDKNAVYRDLTKRNEKLFPLMQNNRLSETLRAYFVGEVVKTLKKDSTSTDTTNADSVKANTKIDTVTVNKSNLNK